MFPRVDESNAEDKQVGSSAMSVAATIATLAYAQVGPDCMLVEMKFPLLGRTTRKKTVLLASGSWPGDSSGLYIAGHVEMMRDIAGPP